ncbi:hypothetical protein K443DRAFT_206906 [Laccaria amethystina LaAM-08-1]|uniref:F-box domain-containing protein n=1 Tax=Laccaria amethystina LaAM-08-1 TaxID=1095629 RepID=A0A0C9X078_9AGAR|nr:hypothetical protein K443DRAFT_206906 [Laccaria amethystina LaAM-08-1]
MDKLPYAPYPHTNYCPSVSEILDIKNLLKKPLARLSTLNAEIEQLNTIICDLYDQHRALSEEIEAHRALMSPFRQLPLDVMGEIFAHCLPTHRNAALSVQEAPLLLGRVCSEWRSVTLSTPRLWASLHIPTPKPHILFGPASIREMDTRCQAVREWILRSGEIPLSISLYSSDPLFPFNGPPDPHRDIETFASVSRQILPFSRRWKTVDLGAIEGSFTHFQDIAEGDVPMLESLSITNIPINNFREPQVSSQAERPWKESSGLLSAPKLRRLSLTYFRGLLDLPVRWSQLTHLKLDAEGSIHASERLNGLRCSQVLNVLKKCPLLVSCSFRLGNTRSDAWIPPYSFETSSSQYALTLAFLQYFSLDLTGSWDEAFLKYLDLPVLRHLEIKVQRSNLGYGSSENQRSVLMDLLSQNGVKLKKLSIEIWAMTQDKLIRCLKSVPFITHLHLNNFNSGSVDEEIADWLTPCRNSYYLCPLLEEFHCRGASFSEAHLLSFVLKRRLFKNGGVLKRVHVIFHRNRPENIEEIFASLETVLEWEGYINFEFEGLYHQADARIFVESGLGHGSTTAVDVKYALKPSTEDSLCPWEGLDG